MTDWTKDYKNDVWTIWLNDPRIRISLVREHRMNPGFWTMHCPELSMDTVSLGLPDTVDASTAQHAAKNMAAHTAKCLWQALSKIKCDRPTPTD